jgi:hypothetical protein
MSPSEPPFLNIYALFIEIPLGFVGIFGHSGRVCENGFSVFEEKEIGLNFN